MAIALPQAPAQGLLSTLVMPPSARPDLAYTKTTGPSAKETQSTHTYTVAGGGYEVPIALFVQFDTSAAVGTRALTLKVLDSLGNTLWAIPAPTTEGPTSTAIYSYAAQLPYASSSVSLAQSSPLPEFWLSPGYQLQWSISSYQANDFFSNVIVTSIFVPSGPPRASELAAGPLTPTPVLV